MKSVVFSRTFVASSNYKKYSQPRRIEQMGQLSTLTKQHLTCLLTNFLSFPVTCSFLTSANFVMPSMQTKDKAICLKWANVSAPTWSHDI